MRRLTQPDESGVAMIFVTLLVTTVIAMAALVIDVGAMVQERRELQNGADSAALAIAHSCALDEAACASDASATTAAALWANGNALDGATSVDSTDIDQDARTVAVVTSTKSASGGDLLPFNFGQVISGKAGEHLHARATATWGTVGSGRTIPLTLSRCEFEDAGFGSGVVMFHNTTKGKNAPATCPIGTPGKDLAGGFGWLDASAPGCQADYTAGQIVSADPGVAMSADCKALFATLLGQKILVPIYRNYTPSGTKATYVIDGFGEFILTGYRFPSASAGSPVPCQGGDTCIGGEFVRFVTSTGSTGGQDFGTYIVKLVS